MMVCYKNIFDADAVDEDHFDNVIKGQEAVTFDLGVDILPHGAAGQEPHLEGRKLK